MSSDEGMPAELRATIARMTSLGGSMPRPQDTISVRIAESAPTVWVDGSPRQLGDDATLQLPVIHTSNAQGGVVDLEMGEVLGEGGMGRVDLAIQTVFGRTVAVKRVKPDQLTVSAVRSLVREARVTGMLEHPNIVPAYALGRSADGPLLVMKRVQGVQWSTLLHDPSRAESAEGPSGDSLGPHLEILRQVCNAVEHAHRRGVVHRDLKAENVMVGDLGEVYLLDWGVAVRLDAERSDMPAGTPAYMAPEMLRGSMDVTPRTDVYLLGAMLHEVLTKAPPHSGKTLAVALLSAFESEPFAYPDSVPAELALVCHTAMARDPAARFGSALLFREAVDAFVRHRGSLDLSTEGERDLVELRRLLGGDTDRDAVRRRAAEADFAFRQAERIWPENVAARCGRQTVTELMIGFELEQKNAPGARALVRSLPEPRPELEARVSALEVVLAADAEARATLERRDHEVDPRVASRARLFVATGIYSALLASLLALEASGVMLTARDLGLALGAALAAYASVLYVARGTLLATQVNRRMHASVAIGAAWSVMALLFSSALGAPTDTAVLWCISGFWLTNVLIPVWSESKSALASALLVSANCGTSMAVGLIWPGHPLWVLACACFFAILVAIARAALRARG